uniref:Uncharacterized protein n=2 Tax=Aegilops tauschii TaxID=37682 RepID=A0A453BM79_AEGTS
MKLLKPLKVVRQTYWMSSMQKLQCQKLQYEEITSWCRKDDEGSSIDVSVIENIKPVEFEDVQFESDDDTNDDEAYVNDGHVAPLGQEESDDDQGFFV